MAERRLKPALGAALTIAIAAVVLLEARPAYDRPAVHAAASASPGLLAKLPDGRRLNFRCSGHGAPTVLMEAGFGATSLAWYKVQPVLAKSHRVCAYDRAGAGFSDPGPLPRDGAAIARDLDDGLKAAGISGPLVMVGHSAGGLYVRLFADRRPDDVIGMVLVDPSVEHQDVRGGPGAAIAAVRARTARCEAAAEQHALPSPDPLLSVCTPRTPADPLDANYQADLKRALQPTTWSTQLSELDNLWTATSVELDAGRPSYGDLPLVVLTAGGPSPGPSSPTQGSISPAKTQMHSEVAERSTRGETELVAGSSHMMMFDRPDAIVAAVDKVIAESKERPKAD